MNIFQYLEQALSAGEDAVLVTVESVSGSAPRGVGAMMAVTSHGRAAGSVGGGSVEYRCEQTALEVLSSRVSVEAAFPLHPAKEGDLGMICGGEVRVSFRYLPGGEDAAIEWVRSEHARLRSRGRVYIFGGGHVSQALVPALAAVDFRCVVLEERPEFCRPELFPGAEAVLRVDYTRVSDTVELTAEDWVIIMTRGHSDDLLVQSQVMKYPVRYIGVIGSRKKTAALTAKLKETGFSDADFEKVWAPIGLPIRSETPAEIAVSITAQLILERAGGLSK
ncbi:MAG: XdhC/CoxI family protein [Butyricicoccus sp.]|nr:XdhC/CoxI family protein [Butyricicoccus sp.]